MSISYAPGTAYALVRPGVVVLLDGSVAAASVSSVWASLERLGRPETSMADVLDAVTTVLDPSLRELPDFAIVLHEASAGGEETGVLHVVARGTVSVHLAGEVGSETIEAFDMTTWADKRFTDVDHYEVAAGPTGLPAELSLALGTGVVTARSVSWQRPVEVASAGDTEAPAVPVDAGDAGPGTVVPVPQAVVAPVEPVAEPDLAMVPVHPVEPDFARTLGEFPDGALDDVALDDEALDDGALEDAAPDDGSRDGAPSDEDLPAGAEIPADEAPAAENPAGASAAAEEPVPDDATVDGTADALAAAGASAPAREAPEHDETGGDSGENEGDEEVEDDTVLSIDGLRSFMKDRDGAASATGEPTDGAAQPVRPALPPVPPPPPAPPVEQEAPAAQQQAPVGSGDSPYPVYQAAPQTPPGEAYAPAPQLQGAPPLSSAPYPGPAPQPAQPYQPAPSAEPAEAHEPASAHAGPPSGQQWTVQLPGTPVAPVAVVGPAPVPAADVPTILARSCAYGHANTPVRSTCAVCGGGLNPQAEVVPRPSLGRVVISTGDVVELEQPVVFGRYPQAHVVTAQAQAPRLVTVPSPSQDISRSHLEVRLEGWNVLLVDLTTVNGTTLLRPGQPPRRLHPQEPTLVVSGDVADLGDGVRLTFEGVA